MKILYLYQFFTTPRWPGATRAYEFGRRLVLSGHTVHMVSSNAGWTGMKLEEQSSKPVGVEEVDGIKVHWLDVGYSNKMGFVRRLAAFLLFSFRALVKVLRLDADVIFATSPPLTIGIPAVIGSIIRRKPLVFEVRDRWPEAAVQMGVLRNRFLIGLAEWFELLLYRRATSVVALTPGIRDELVGAGVLPEKIVVIPNSCDLELFSNPAGAIDRPSPYDFGDKFVATYCGVHGEANGLDYLVDCAKACEEAGFDQFFLLLVGDGKTKSELEKRVNREGLRNVGFWKPIAKSEIPNLFAASDVGLTIFKDLPILRTCSPNKFFDCLAAGRPVITNMSGWLSNMVEKEGAGCHVNPRDPRDFAIKLQRYANDRVVWKETCQQARRLGESRFDRNVLASELETVLKSAVAEMMKGRK